jgi:hypothetical protein
MASPKPTAFKLPKEISYQKTTLANGEVAYVFRHETLGELGRLRVAGTTGNQTHIQAEVIGAENDPLTALRKSVFEPIARVFIDTLETVKGKGRQTALIPSSGEAHVIESKLMPCKQCGHPAAMMINTGAETPGELADYARLMHKKILDLQIPTWVVGFEKEVKVKGKLTGKALVAMVWPFNKKAEMCFADDFNKEMDSYIHAHCSRDQKTPKIKAVISDLKNLTSADCQRLGSQYAGWRGYLEGFFGLLFQENKLTEAFTRDVARKLGLFTHGDIGFSSPSEKALFEDYAYFHYGDAGTTLISRVLDKNPDLLKKDYKQIGNAVKKAYFTGLMVLEVVDLSQGIMRVFDMVCKEERLFIDRAFSKSADMHFDKLMMLSTVIDTKDFLFTTGAGIPIDRTSYGGKKIVDAMEGYTKKHKANKPLSKAQSLVCTTDIISQCLRGGALAGHTLNYI